MFAVFLLDHWKMWMQSSGYSRSSNMLGKKERKKDELLLSLSVAWPNEL